MSRRKPTRGDAPREGDILPFLGNLSLVKNADISAPKRKSAALPDKSTDVPELTQKEKEDLERTAVSYMRAASQVLQGSSLHEAETLAKRIPTSLFAYSREDQANRRDIFAAVLSERFWIKKVWGNPGEAAPRMDSSVVRLLQSIKGYDYAAAHHPQLPSSFSPSDTSLVQSHRKILKAAVAMTKESIPTGQPAEESVTQADLEAFENALGGVILFGDIQTAPIHERDNTIAYFDSKIDKSTEVDVVTVSIMRSHFDLMYSMTMKILSFSRTYDSSEAMNAMGVPSLETYTGVGGQLYNHIVADLSASRSNKVCDRMVQAYWKLLRKILFSLPAVGDPMQLDIDEDGQNMRDNAPPPEEIRQFKKMHDDMKSSATLDEDEKTNIKIAFIQMVVRVAAFKGWSWFAQSPLNLYTLQALMVRESRWQTESARFTQGQASEAAQNLLAGKTPEERDAVLKHAAERAGAPPEGQSDMLDQTGQADPSTSGDAADDEKQPADAEERDAVLKHAAERAGAPPEGQSDMLDQTGQADPSTSGDAADGEKQPADAPLLSADPTESETGTTVSPEKTLEAAIAANSSTFLQAPLHRFQTRNSASEIDDSDTTPVGGLEPSAPSAAEACSQNAMNAIRIQLEIKASSKEATDTIQASRDRKTESDAKQAEVTQLKDQLAQTQEAKKKLDERVELIQAAAKTVAEAAVKDKNLLKEAQKRTIEKIADLVAEKERANQAELELHKKITDLEEEVKTLKETAIEAEKNTSQTIIQILQKLTKSLTELQYTARNVPPSSVANAQYEKDKQVIDEAKLKIMELASSLKFSSTANMLNEIEQVVDLVSATAEQQKEGWLDSAWRWMKAQGSVIEQVVQDPKLADKMFGYANALFSHSKTLFLVLSVLQKRLRTIDNAFPTLPLRRGIRRLPMDGLFDIDSVFVWAGLFSLGSLLLVRAQNKDKEEEDKDSWNKYVFLYRGAVQFWGQMTGNLNYGYRSFLPFWMRDYILKSLGGSALVNSSQLSKFDVFLEGVLNIATISSIKNGGPLLLKSVGMNALLGNKAECVSKGIETALLVLDKIYMLQEVASSWETIKTMSNLPLRIYQHIRVGPIQVVIDRGVQTATMFLNGLRFVVRLPYDLMVYIGNVVSSHPGLAIGCLLLGLSVAYAQKHYKVLDNESAKAKATYADVVKGVKRSRMLQPVPETCGRWTVLLRAVARNMIQRGTAGTSSEGSGDTMQVDDRQDGDEYLDESMREEDDSTGSGGVDDDEDDGSGDSISAAVAEMAKLQGMKINDPFCGSFVVVSKPSKQPPRLSACLALMLNTELHGMGR